MIDLKNYKNACGVLIDSGDIKEQTEKIIEKCQSLVVVYGNTTFDEAIEQHKRINGRIKDCYGISTHLATQITDTEINKRNFPYFLTR